MVCVWRKWKAEKTADTNAFAVDEKYLCEK